MSSASAAVGNRALVGGVVVGGDVIGCTPQLVNMHRQALLHPIKRALPIIFICSHHRATNAHKHRGFWNPNALEDCNA
jgi:hypothetical protein